MEPSEVSLLKDILEELRKINTNLEYLSDSKTYNFYDVVSNLSNIDNRIANMENRQ